jgi:thiamine biosynthesis lipoprotein
MHSILRFLVVLLGFAYFSLAQAQWHHFTSTAMTTKLDLEFWLADELQAKQISERVFLEFDRIEAVMTRYGDTSELSIINRLAGEKTLPVSASLFKVLQSSKQMSVLSEGAFDMTFASVGYLYDFRNKRVPTNLEIERQKSAIDFRYVQLNKKEQTLRFAHPNVLIDLGGIAKGYAVDQGVLILKLAGVAHARLSAGGDMRLLGDKKGKPWIVGVKDPRATLKNTSNAVVLPLSDVSISTSGDYERFFIDDDGERIHHIISPKTGRSVQGVQSVSVIGPDTLTSDGLSTAIFVLGVKKGLALANRLEGIDVIMIDAQRQLHFSEGLMSPALP